MIGIVSINFPDENLKLILSSETGGKKSFFKESWQSCEGLLNEMASWAKAAFNKDLTVSQLNALSLLLNVKRIELNPPTWFSGFFYAEKAFSFEMLRAKIASAKVLNGDVSLTLEYGFNRSQVWTIPAGDFQTILQRTNSANTEDLKDKFVNVHLGPGGIKCISLP